MYLFLIFLQIDLRQDLIETYPGPPEPVDVILMVHVCYYFRDSFPVQIKRALQWLRPGGHLVLVHKEISPFRSEIGKTAKVLLFRPFFRKLM